MATLYKDTILYEPLRSYIAQHVETFQARPSDIVVVSYPKYGTTWLKSIVYSIEQHHSTSTDDNPLLQAPFIHRAITNLDIDSFGLSCQGEGRKRINASGDDSRRLYAYHLPYRALPPSIHAQRCKILYITRNPKDTIVSAANFFINSATQGAVFRQKSDADASLDEIVERNARMMLDGREPFGPLVRHAVDMWNASSKSECGNPILFLHYEQLQADYERQVRRIADFLGQASLTDEQIAAVCQRNSFAQLRDTMLDKDNTGSGVSADCFFQRGTTGQWRSVMSVKTAVEVDRFVEEQLAGTDFRYKET